MSNLHIDGHTTTKPRDLMAAIAAAALCTGISASAHGATIAHEGFEYTYSAVDANPLHGGNRGTGWAGAWSSSPKVAGAGSGAYIDNKTMAFVGLSSTGSAVKLGRSGWSQPGGNDGGGVATRSLNLSEVNPTLLSGGRLGANNTTIWLAFTAYGSNWFNGNAGNKIGLSLTSDGVEQLSIGANGGAQSPGSWVLTPNLGSAAGETPIISSNSQVHLFVVRVAFAAGNETVTVWCDPNVGGTAPTGGAQVVNGSFPDFTFNGIMLQSNRTDGAPVFDEIRVGTDFRSVVDDMDIISHGTIADESFDYGYTAPDTNVLSGRVGGTGWAAPWGTSPTVLGRGAGAYIDGKNMGYPVLDALGRAAKIGRNGWSQPGGDDGGGAATRPLDLSGVHKNLLQGGRLGADNTTIWLAFTAYGSNWFNGNSGNKIGLSLTSGGTEKLSIGANGGAQSVGSWVLTPNLGSPLGETHILPHNSAVHLFVVKITFAAGSESLTVWGDPNIGGSGPTGGVQVVNASFPSFTFDGIKLQSNRTDGVPVFDDIRVGTTFGSVIGRERDLRIVAHQDDDLLFMNPDLARSIESDHVVRTVYVTDGEGNTPHDINYVIGREDGVMAAYAQMAGESNNWSCNFMNVASRMVTRCTLNDRISLVFLRLPASVGGATLSSLWSQPGYTVTDWNTGATYTRQDVINVLKGIMQDFGPNTVSTGESGYVYGGDHEEHNISALFALEAHHAYAGEHRFVRYRGYDIGGAYPNLTTTETDEKVITFRWYAACDYYMCSTESCGEAMGCAPGGYQSYYTRQYSIEGIAPGSGPIGNVGGGCLTASAAGVSMAGCASSAEQTWTLTVGHKLVSSDGRCLSSSGQSGTAVALDTCAAVPEQRWTPLEDGLILGASGKCLALNGDAVQVADCILTSEQLWTIDTTP